MMPNGQPPLRPVPTPPPWQVPFDSLREHVNGRVDVQTARLTKALDRIEELESMVLGQAEELAVVKRRLATSGTPTEPTVDDRILAFLRSVPGIRFTAISVAENVAVPGAVSGYASKALRRLAKAGKVQMAEEQGRRAAYWVPREES